MTDAKKVLLLLSDTDAVFSRVCKNKFESLAGWSPVITASYTEALEITKKEKPSLILTDIILNEGSGFDLLTNVKQSEDPVISAASVVILTDLGQDADREKAMQLGAAAYMVKNEVSINDVIDKMKSMI